MAIEPCAPCECIPGNIPNDKFKQDVELILCDILTAIQGGGGVGENVNVASWGGVATSLGQKVMASSVPVVIASDQSPIAVGPVTPGTGATNLGKAEDAAHTSGDVGVFALAVSATTPATSTNADGDYSQITTNRSGVAYSEPANQVATYADSATSGAAGAITTAGVNVLTNTAKAKLITVLNKTDVDILISPNAGTNYPYAVPANGGVAAFDLGANGRWTASSISAKAIGSNSSSGTLYVGLTI